MRCIFFGGSVGEILLHGEVEVLVLCAGFFAVGVIL